MRSAAELRLTTVPEVVDACGERVAAGEPRYFGASAEWEVFPSVKDLQGILKSAHVRVELVAYASPVMQTAARVPEPFAMSGNAVDDGMAYCIPKKKAQGRHREQPANSNVTRAETKVAAAAAKKLKAKEAKEAKAATSSKKVTQKAATKSAGGGRAAAKRQKTTDKGMSVKSDKEMPAPASTREVPARAAAKRTAAAAGLSDRTSDASNGSSGEEDNDDSGDFQ
ncbi:hypothetical protein H9P43_002128 [Blastocladiella emersonii ATCC 22665]|nr:hypothetical protein H9P43_002128 [Blastocladiella emersonii ATCC 22665]